MSAAVLTLPTRPTVEAAWLRHCNMQQRLINNPDLQNDPEFAAECQDAQAQWLNVFQLWSERAA